MYMYMCMYVCMYTYMYVYVCVYVFFSKLFQLFFSTVTIRLLNYGQTISDVLGIPNQTS